MGLLGWLRRSTPKLGTDGLSEALVREATDYVVRMCDPRIALLGRYRERLAPPMTCALQFVQQQHALLDQPVLASPDAWPGTPLLRAVFASPDDMQRIFSQCTDLVEWLNRNPANQEVVATLGMALREQKTLGMAMQGDVMQRDVVQTTLSFSEHRARIFSDSPATLWRGVARRIVDELAFIALSRFEAEQTSRKELEEDLALLRARLRTFERRGTGIDHLAAGSSVQASVEGRKLLHQLEENERRLAQMGASSDLLELRLNMLIETLLQPEKYVHIDKHTVCVDSMNRVVEETQLDGNPISYVSVKVDRTPPLERVLVAMRIPRTIVQPVGLRLDDAAKLLG